MTTKNKQVVYKRPLITNKTKEEFEELVEKVNSYKEFYKSYKISIEFDEDVNVEINIKLNVSDVEVVLVGLDVEDMMKTVDNFFLGYNMSK